MNLWAHQLQLSLQLWNEGRTLLNMNEINSKIEIQFATIRMVWAAVELLLLLQTYKNGIRKCWCEVCGDKGWNVQPPTATKIGSKILNCIQWIHSLDLRWWLIVDILLTTENHHYHQIDRFFIYVLTKSIPLT